MKRTPILLLMLLVILPLVLLGWTGVRLARHERLQLEQQVRELLADRLHELDRDMAAHFAALAVDCQRLTDLENFDIEKLREIVRRDPRIFQLFVIDPDEGLSYPNPQGPLTQTEREFILRASQIFNDYQLERLAGLNGDAEEKSALPVAPSGNGGAGRGRKTLTPALSQGERATLEVSSYRGPAQDTGVVQDAGLTSASLPTPHSGGWFVWYWGPGMNLIYWQRLPTGHIVGVALERARWIADLIADLPDTPMLTDSTAVAATQSRIRLVESGTDVIYQWGTFEPGKNAVPACEIRLSDPLSAWQLQTFAPIDLITAGTGSGIYFNMVAGLLLSSIALAALAFVFYQQYARDMRDAGQRVSFVNQVSHELRTPLTNIRMYADLLEADLQKLDEPSDELQRRLSVITSESQRLSRLIGNVLTFARQERNTLQLAPKPQIVDQVIREVLSGFTPSLEQKQIHTELDLEASDCCLVDSDALGQILGNLINNVEKYAAGGKWMRIASSQQGDRTIITISDKGPGIADSHRASVFEPFWRASNDLNQAAGTGIGLTIARHLARLHGGDVTVLPSSQGTTFEVHLATPFAKGGNT